MRGLSIVFYGTEGVGKTSLALEFPKELLCISVKENGFENLELVGDIPEGCDHESAETFPQLLNILKKAKDYTTVVVDSVSGVAQLMTSHILKQIYDNHENPQQAFASFSEGDRKHAPIFMEKFCSELTLLNNQGVNTIILGHARQETVKNPTGNDYNATVIDMESWPRAVLTKWAGAVIYMTLDLEVMVTKTWKGKPVEGKARQDLEALSDRIMYTTKHPSHSAKNLYKLPPYISLGESPQEAYKAFTKSLPENLRKQLGITN
jgi:DNA polymerase III delta prime subunit